MIISTDYKNKYWIRFYKSPPLNFLESDMTYKNNLNLNLSYDKHGNVYRDEKKIISYSKEAIYELDRFIGNLQVGPNKFIESNRYCYGILNDDNSEIISVYSVNKKHLILKESNLVGVIKEPWFRNYIEISFNNPELLTYMLILGELYYEYTLDTF